MLKHPDTAAVFKLNLIVRGKISRFPAVATAPGTSRRPCARRCGVGLARLGGGRGRGRRTWGAMVPWQVLPLGLGTGTRCKDTRNVPSAASPSAGAAGTERYLRVGFSVAAPGQPRCLWRSVPASCARAPTLTQRPGGCPCRWSTGRHISVARGFARRRRQRQVAGPGPRLRTKTRGWGRRRAR